MLRDTYQEEDWRVDAERGHGRRNRQHPHRGQLQRAKVQERGLRRADVGLLFLYLPEGGWKIERKCEKKWFSKFMRTLEQKKICMMFGWEDFVILSMYRRSSKVKTVLPGQPYWMKTWESCVLSTTDMNIEYFWCKPT